MTKADELREQALKLRAAGTPVEEIIAKTGLEAQEVVDILAEEDSTLTTLQGIRQEAALISFAVTKRDRLQKIVQLRNRLEEEMDKRDFSDIPTEKLPRLLLKVNEAIRAEVTIPQILSTPVEEEFYTTSKQKKNIANE